MNVESATLNILLIVGLFLLLVGTFLYFAPGLLIKLNAVGNKWIGDPTSHGKRSTLRTKLFSADYTLFANHKTYGRIMLGVSSLMLIIYTLYRV